MNLKKLVTVIVAGFALCLMFSLSCEAATTKATTKDKKKNSYTEVRAAQAKKQSELL